VWRAVAACAIALAAAATPARGARLDLTGTAHAPRAAEAALAPALRAPGDSATLASALGVVVASLQNDGFLEARARGAWSAPAAGGAPETLSVRVEEGPRHRVTSLALTALSAGDSGAIASAFAVRPGAWASPAGIAAAVGRALQQLADDGYPYAVLGVNRWSVDADGLRLGLSGGLGPRVTVSGVRFAGARVTRPGFLARAVGRIAGLPYNRSAAEEGRQRLEALGLFRRVEYEGVEGEADWGRGVLVYRVEEPAYHRFEGVIGTQGEGRVVGLANVELENLAGTGRAAALRWESRGRGVTHFAARYSEPLVSGLPLALEGRLEQQLQDTLYARTRWGAHARFALSARRHLEAGYEQERVVQDEGVVREAGTQNTRFALARRTFAPRTTPRRGSAVTLGAVQSFKRERLRAGGGRSARASAVELAGEWHRPLTARAGVTVEARGAGRFSSDRILPDYERYPLGGAASLRGYDEEEFRVDRYALARLEWRWFPAGDGAYGFGFWDHAVAATRVAAGASDRLDTFQRDGYGCGLSLASGTGEVRIDYGLAPGRGPLEGKVHLRLVSGF
jgi:outer membrane protein assembly factor BamA